MNILPRPRTRLFSILFIGLTALTAIAQERSPAGKTVHDIDIAEESAFTSLVTLSRQFGRPVGFVRAIENRKEIFFTLKMNSATLEDALDSMVRQDSRYKWEVVGGVVHFWPATGIDPILSKLLNLSVSRFSLPTVRESFKLRTAVYNLPEVTEFFSSNKLIWDPIEISRFFGAKPKDVNIELVDAKVFEILDQMVTKSDSKVWILARFEFSNDSILINFS